MLAGHGRGGLTDPAKSLRNAGTHQRESLGRAFPLGEGSAVVSYRLLAAPATCVLPSYPDQPARREGPTHQFVLERGAGYYKYASNRPFLSTQPYDYSERGRRWMAAPASTRRRYL
jgi:hypothetical protein